VVECFWYKHRLRILPGEVPQRGVQAFSDYTHLDEVRKSLWASPSFDTPRDRLLGLEGLHEALNRSVV